MLADLFGQLFARDQAVGEHRHSLPSLQTLVAALARVFPQALDFAFASRGDEVTAHGVVSTSLQLLPHSAHLLERLGHAVMVSESKFLATKRHAKNQ